jgi:hypothetical protein
MIKKIFSVLLLPLIIIQPSCKKLVEVSPPVTQLTSSNVYTGDATATAVLIGIYTIMSGANPTNTASSVTSISLASGLSADELTLYGGSVNTNTALVNFYTNKLTPGFSTATGFYMWNEFYRELYTVNIALERLAVSNSLTPAVKQQLTGEAKFLRAFLYLYMVNLYGDVPLITTSNYVANNVLSRTARAQVYQQVITDLKDAQNLLVDGYIGADTKATTTERVRPNKWAATALLARAYLYTGDWPNAEAQANAVINNTVRYGLETLSNTFLKNSREAIWQLQPVNAGWNTEDAKVFILPSTGPTANGGYPVHLSSQLANSFEAGDQRKLIWVNTVSVNSALFYYPYKYKSATLNAPVTEYLMVLRLGEQYLIRAEARAQQGNISGAQSDVNTIRTRAGLPATTANDKTSLLSAILHERQVELFTEWGHRWLDLKRTGNIDAVMTAVAPAKGSVWSTNWQLYPIPLYDITQNPNLVQNTGY